MDEKYLINASRGGNLQAFEVLIKPYEQGIYNFLFKMCRSKESAEDMTQETFINVFKNLVNFRSEAKLSTWIFQIATNNCLMLKRREHPEQNISLDAEIPAEDKDVVMEIADWSQNPSEIYDKNELKTQLDAALDQLPEIYRAVWILKDLEGFTAQEISEMLKISLPNVKARILRARIKLQKLLKEKLIHA